MGIVGNMGIVGKRGRERLSVLCGGYPFRAGNRFLVRAAPTVYHAMTALVFASESPYKGRIRLEGDVRGTSVLILGAGLAG
jgi:hypothetical protein